MVAVAAGVEVETGFFATGHLPTGLFCAAGKWSVSLASEQQC
jgi:hypothetical protein